MRAAEYHKSHPGLQFVHGVYRDTGSSSSRGMSELGALLDTYLGRATMNRQANLAQRVRAGSGPRGRLAAKPAPLQTGPALLFCRPFKLESTPLLFSVRQRYRKGEEKPETVYIVIKISKVRLATSFSCCWYQSWPGIPVSFSLAAVCLRSQFLHLQNGKVGPPLCAGSGKSHMGWPHTWHTVSAP